MSESTQDRWQRTPINGMFFQNLAGDDALKKLEPAVAPVADEPSSVPTPDESSSAAPSDPVVGDAPEVVPPADASVVVS